MSNWAEAIEFIKSTSLSSSVYVGCDSVRSRDKNDNWKATYFTVVVVHMNSKNGCRIFSNVITEDDYGAIKPRMIREVSLAVEAALAIIDHLDGRYLEVHVDVNTDNRFPSSVAVPEAIGYVKGMLGINPKLKPDAWAATHAADHVGRIH